MTSIYSMSYQNGFLVWSYIFESFLKLLFINKYTYSDILIKILYHSLSKDLCWSYF